MPLTAAAAALIGMGIQGGTSAGSSILQARQSTKNVNKTNKANMELAKYQYDRDVEMWERNNAYNSPEAQMERLQKAGLNPNLVYGTGAVGNTSGQTPKYQAPRMDYTGRMTPDLTGLGFAVNSGMAMYNDFQLKQAQIDNVKANTAQSIASTTNTNERTASEIIKRAKYMTEGEKARLETDILSALKESTIQAKQAQNQLTVETAPYQAQAAELEVKQLVQQMSFTQKKMATEAINQLIKEQERIRAVELNRNLPADKVLDQAIKELDMKQREIVLTLMQQGVNFNDPAWQRWLSKFLPDLKSLENTLKEDMAQREGWK